MPKDISRKDFLKGVGAGAVSLTAIGALAGCTSSSASATSKTTDSAAKTAASDSSYGTILNPQTDFTADSGDYSSLFSELKIGGVTLKNRIVKSCAGSEMQKSTDWPSDTSLEYYGQFAKGGIGMICYEPSTIDPNGMSMTDALASGNAGATTGGAKIEISSAQMDISTDEGIEAHKAVADYLHNLDTPVIAQMLDMMMATGGGGTYHDAKALETSMNPGIMQTTEQVHAEQQNFINAGIRYWKAGFDGVEINCSCNHYFSTFLSRISNHERTDEYSGDSIENRCRIVTEIIEGIRKETGDDFIIQVLYSGIEENISELGDNENCITVEEACEMGKLFEKAGASCLHIRSQAYGHHCAGFMPDVLHMFEDGNTGYGSVIDYKKHFEGMVDGSRQGYGALIDVAAKIKSSVSIPVGTVGSMDPCIAPDFFNNAIKDGKIDYILMTRALMADPALPNKLKNGQKSEIAPCNRCMTCFVAPFGIGLPMYCRVNPAITRAYTEDMPEGYDPSAAETPKKVMVIGGGPAGMEAARIAGERGHTVTLYDKNKTLGGRLSFVQALKGPHERITDYENYLINQETVNNVTVVTEKEVDLDFIKSENPDVVVVASGGVRPEASYDADSDAEILHMDELADHMDGEQLQTGDTTVIIGGQFQACEVAANLARFGHKVILLNTGASSDFYLNGTIWTKLMGSSWIKSKGVRIYHAVTDVQVSKGSVAFRTESGVDMSVTADTVIDAEPLAANRTLFDSLTGVVSEVYAVGDCYSPNTIANATARANIVARKIGAGTADSSTALADNQFRGTATGIGDVTVTITVEDGKITECIVDTSNETAGVGKDLGEKFGSEIVENGSIDSVSGATVTSSAVTKALDKAKKLAGID